MVYRLGWDRQSHNPWPSVHFPESRPAGIATSPAGRNVADRRLRDPCTMFSGIPSISSGDSLQEQGALPPCRERSAMLYSVGDRPSLPPIRLWLEQVSMS